MSYKVLNRVLFTALTSGLTDFGIGSSILGYMVPSTAGAVNGDTFHYTAQSSDLTEWEVGLGTYSSTGPTLVRTTILFSTNSNNKVDFALAPQVFATITGETSPINRALPIATTSLLGAVIPDGSTITVDGSGVISSSGGGGGSAFKSYDHTFTSTEIYTTPNDANSLSVHSATNGISFTIKMPATPTDGQQIIFYQPPDGNTYFITFSANVGQSIVGFPSSFSGSATKGILVIWNQTNTTWYSMRAFQ